MISSQIGRHPRALARPGPAPRAGPFGTGFNGYLVIQGNIHRVG